MGSFHKGHHTGPRKKDLHTDPDRNIWKVYWNYKWHNKTPVKGTRHHAMYNEALRKQREDKFSSNKWPTTYDFK